MDTNKIDKQVIQSVGKAFDILEALIELDGASVSTLAEYLEMPKSTTYRYLATLDKQDVIVNNCGEYQLSLQFLNYGGYVRQQYDYSDIIHEKTFELASRTGERSQFFVEEHGQGIHLYTESGEHGISADVRIGKTVPLHATSAGKAILAYLPKEEVEEILDQHGMPKYTENTITDKSILFEQLSEVRETKIAYNREERVEGFYAIGSPIIFNECVIGAFSVAGSKRRMEGKRAEKEIPNILLELTEEIELRLEYDH